MTDLQTGQVRREGPMCQALSLNALAPTLQTGRQGQRSNEWPVPTSRPRIQFRELEELRFVPLPWALLGYCTVSSISTRSKSTPPDIPRRLTQCLTCGKPSETTGRSPTGCTVISKALVCFKSLLYVQPAPLQSYCSPYRYRIKH